jgi:hypothetical protein
MRIDARTKGDVSLRQWADNLQLPFLGALRETQTYVKCLEHGLTVFDMPAAKVEADLAQWRPIIDFVSPLLQPLAANEPGARPVPKAETKLMAKPVQKPTRPVLPPGSLPSGSLRPVAVSPEVELTAARTAPGALDALPAVPVAQAEVPEPTPVNGKAAETAKIHRLVPVSPVEELDSHFGGLTTRIGRWLESLSVKRAR